jgi:hypothetical protein
LKIAQFRSNPPARAGRVIPAKGIVMKPEVVDVLKIIAMKQRAKELYEKIDEAVLELAEEFGAGRFDYDLNLVPPQDEDSELFDVVIDYKSLGQYMKFEIVDNLEKLEAGESVFTSASIKPVSFSSRSLKNIPKSLK